jgi:hypothetical protein
VNTKVCTRYLLRYFLPHSDHNARTVVGGLGHFFTMSDNKLGFTFYPKDWWTSETYFEFDAFERYLYLECLFIMYSNDGYLKTQKTQFENRTRTQVKNEVWEKITSKFILTENGYTHESVNKRLRKTLANRANGQKGGRPSKTQKTQLENPKKPTLERERERERESEIEYKKNIQKKFFDFGVEFSAELGKMFFDFLEIQKSPKNEIQIEALIKKLKSFPSEKTRIEGLEASIRAGYSDVYLPKEEKQKNLSEQPEVIFVDGKRCVAVRNGNTWVYPDIYAVEINREANTALLSDGSIQPLTEQQKSFNEAEFQFIKKVVYP